VYLSRNGAAVDLARKSVVALMSAARVDESDPKAIRFNAKTLKAKKNVCPETAFADQPTVAVGSAILSADDLILTAGHAFEPVPDEGLGTVQKVCDDTRLVFDYYYEDKSSLKKITQADVFRCKSVIVEEHEFLKDTSGDGIILDYAIVQLDRKVDLKQRMPVALPRVQPKLKKGDALLAVGFPNGVPAKVGSGIVVDPRQTPGDYFGANPDTFGGNSGSGLFLTTASGVAYVGLLARGQADYELDKSRGCNVPHKCLERCSPADEELPSGFEEATYAHHALGAFCRVQPSHAICGKRPIFGALDRMVGPAKDACARITPEAAKRGRSTRCRTPVDQAGAHARSKGSRARRAAASGIP